MVELAIRNGRIVTPTGIVPGDIGVQDGKIVAVGSASEVPGGKREIDAGELFVIPGLIDPHVHLPSGAWPTLEDGLCAQFSRETEGALHGGVTTFGNFVVSPVGQSLLPALEATVAVGEELSFNDFFCHALIMDEGHIAEEPELCRRGVTSFKHMFNAYKGKDGMGKYAPCDEGMLFRSMEFIAGWGYPAIAMCHCEEMDIIFTLMERLQEAGRDDLLAWTEARPGFAEAMRISHAMNIARAAGCPLYIVHVSTAEGIALVAREQRRGYPVYAETCPHYLTHTGDMEAEIGCWGKVNPSLKYTGDKEALWQHIGSGTVNTLGTDHVTYDREQKEQGGGQYGNIWQARPGICGGMEHLLPLMMTYGVHAGLMTIEDLVRVGAYETARIFGLYPRKGSLLPGADADIVIVDPEKEAVIGPDFYHCQAEFAIYNGWKMKGMARTAVIRGEVMMEDYTTVGKAGHGNYLPCRA